MKKFRNHITLIGKMVNRAQITTYENGSKVARFKIKSDELQTDSQITNKSTLQHRLFAWGNIAEFLETYGDTDKPLAIHGRMVRRTYVSSKGVMKKLSEIEVRNIIGL